MPLLAHNNILRYEEIEQVIRSAASLGITKVRITGGEPLIRKDLAPFLARVSKIVGISELALTTNGALLSIHAHSLKQAGLSRINVSLDSLKRERFKHITNQDNLADVLRGIEAAQAEGFETLKTNTVLMKGLNEDEVLDFVEFGIRRRIQVRFIELMPTNSSLFWQEDRVMRSADLIRHIRTRYELDPIVASNRGPAEQYKVRGTDAIIGFISPISCKFCMSCNRLRLTSDGKLLSCLHGEPDVDLRALLRDGMCDDELSELIRSVVRSKPREHRLEKRDFSAEHTMSRIGG